MYNDYFKEKTDTIYGQEQEAFAEMQEKIRICKRQQRRRRALIWVLRRL